MAHGGDLGRGFQDAQSVEQGLERRGGRELIGAWEHKAEVCVGVDGACAFENSRQQPLGLRNVARHVCVEDVLGGLYPAPRPGPLLESGVLGSHVKVEEEVVEAGAGFLDDGERLWLSEASEIQKVGVLAEGVKDSPGAPLYRRRGQDGKGIEREGGGERGAAVVVLLRRDGWGYCTKLGAVNNGVYLETKSARRKRKKRGLTFARREDMRVRFVDGLAKV